MTELTGPTVVFALATLFTLGASVTALAVDLYARPAEWAAYAAVKIGLVGLMVARLAAILQGTQTIPVPIYVAGILLMGFGIVGVTKSQLRAHHGSSE